jgi:hypothetical protein
VDRARYMSGAVKLPARLWQTRRHHAEPTRPCPGLSASPRGPTPLRLAILARLFLWIRHAPLFWTVQKIAQFEKASAEQSATTSSLHRGVRGQCRTTSSILQPTRPLRTHCV